MRLHHFIQALITAFILIVWASYSSHAQLLPEKIDYPVEETSFHNQIEDVRPLARLTKLEHLF